MNPVFHAAFSAAAFADPVSGVFGGMISHAALDCVFDEHRPQIDPADTKTWIKKSLWIIWQVGGCLAIGYMTGRWWAVLGGVLPDLVDGAWWLYNKLVKKLDTWQTGKHLCPWHKMQSYWMTLTATETLVLELVVFLTAISACNRWGV